MRPWFVLPLLMVPAVGCSGDDETSRDTTTTAGGPVVVFTDNREAGFDCLSIHVALAAAVDDEGDSPLEYLDADELRRNGTFGPVVVERMLEDPSPEWLGAFAAVCEENGYPAP